jgi:CubicO group peptidase (beta-lactamase class C family)
MAAQHIPGLALAIIQGDQVRYVKGYGVARDDQPVIPYTQFHLASLSKSFTAVAILQLEEAGQVDLDAPVQRYLREFTLADPAVAAQITVRQLLNHTSGLADAGIPDLRLPRPATSRERLATLQNAHPVAAPGREFHYTDVNYQVLARVVEVVSGQSFTDYLHTHLFAPLQMMQTVNVLTSFEVTHTADHLAQGHLLAFGLPIASGEETGYLGGSGGVISTAADMAHYLLMHNNAGCFAGQQMLSPASIAVLHTPPPNLQSDYAMGWVAHVVDGQRVLEHNGILSTFYADMVLLPESGQGFVLLSNVHSLAHDVLGFPRLKRGLMALLTGEQPVTGGGSVGLWGILIGVITMVSVALEVRGLWRLPRWRQQAVDRPWWRHLLGLVWAFTPAALVLAMPAIVLSASGRAFGYITLCRAMLGVMIWLGLCGVLGACNGLARLVWLVRQTRHPAY